MSYIVVIRRIWTFDPIMRHPSTPKTPAPKKIGILALPGVQMLDVAGPLDVFAEANVQSGRDAYAPCVISTVEGPIVSSSGLRILPDIVLGTHTLSAFDTLLVAGAPHLGEIPADPALLDWLRKSAPKSRRFGSVCSGAMLLAATGLLDGRRITTHWAIARTTRPLVSGGPGRDRRASRPRRSDPHRRGRHSRARSGACAG